MRKGRTYTWVYLTALNSGDNIVVPYGGQGSTSIVAYVDNCNWLTFSFITEQTSSLYIECSFTSGFVNVDTICSLVGIAAATRRTPYDLPAPLNGSGVVVLTAPWIRIRIADTAVANHAFTRLYAKAW